MYPICFNSLRIVFNSTRLTDSDHAMSSGCPTVTGPRFMPWLGSLTILQRSLSARLTPGRLGVCNERLISRRVTVGSCVGDDSRSGATTLIAQDRLIGVYSAHLTKKLGAEVHRIGPESVRSPSALKIDGGNTLQIEVNERGSYLILNGELQIHAPIAKLNPKSSPVGLCVGFFLGEASEYELQYWDMTGGAR